ncbi:DNA alkylation repair protein [Yimella sp. cx-573]|nr:DNA alkylation repair protein [Yimella sp. cx-573]
MSADAAQLVAAVRAALVDAGDPERAAAQQKYMKSSMPYYGISASALRALLKQPLSEHRLADVAEWQRAIRMLWDEGSHREHWYAALAVARHRYYKVWRTDLKSLPLYEHLVRTGRWWDVCDETASHLIAPLLDAHRGTIEPVMRQWSRDPELWIRRVAVQSQLSLKADTDPALLGELIVPNLDDTTFWMRKAIGWSLREYSKVDPEWVRDFVAEHEARLSGLSRREALRLIDR